MDQNLNMKGEPMELVEENRRSLWAWSGPKKKKTNRTRKASIIKEKFDTLDYIKTKDILVLKLGCQRIHNMSARHGTENQAGVLPCGLQKLPWLRPVTLLFAPSIEKWLRVEISGLLQGWGTRISQESRMWFCYVRGSFVPQPPQSPNPGAFFSEHSLEIPWALRLSRQVCVGRRTASRGPQAWARSAVWCPSSLGPRALEEAQDAVRPSPALCGGPVLVRTDEAASETEPAAHTRCAHCAHVCYRNAWDPWLRDMLPFISRL